MRKKIIMKTELLKIYAGLGRRLFMKLPAVAEGLKGLRVFGSSVMSDESDDNGHSGGSSMAPK